MPIDHLYVFIGKVYIQGFCVFFNDFLIILNCVSSLYSLDINPLLDTSFTNIFSHSEGHLFFLLMVSFVVQKPFSLMQFHLFTLAVVSLA